MTKPNKKSPRDEGLLRIIGGEWRGRKLAFPALPGLRPSPDRVRETLFNWLQPTIVGARCLDLFAGSGALGLEALSRGAETATFVDSAPAAARRIAEHLTTLRSDRGRTVTSDTAGWLATTAAQPFDVVFLDPPFRQGLLDRCCELLETRGWLASEAAIYMEAGTDEPLPAVPTSWRIHRDKVAGQVAYRLWLRTSDSGTVLI